MVVVFTQHFLNHTFLKLFHVVLYGLQLARGNFYPIEAEKLMDFSHKLPKGHEFLFLVAQTIQEYIFL